jgi:hypothetical protein
MAKTTVKKKAAKTATKSAAKATKTTKTTPREPALNQPVALADRLDTLLHTVRCIAQHEDELCTLLHAARKSQRTTATLVRDLRSILDELPAEEYAWELRALEEELDSAA